MQYGIYHFERPQESGYSYFQKLTEVTVAPSVPIVRIFLHLRLSVGCPEWSPHRWTFQSSKEINASEAYLRYGSE